VAFRYRRRPAPAAPVQPRLRHARKRTLQGHAVYAAQPLTSADAMASVSRVLLARPRSRLHQSTLSAMLPRMIYRNGLVRRGAGRVSVFVYSVSTCKAAARRASRPSLVYAARFPPPPEMSDALKPAELLQSLLNLIARYWDEQPFVVFVSCAAEGPAVEGPCRLAATPPFVTPSLPARPDRRGSGHHLRAQAVGVPVQREWGAAARPGVAAH
jgi:hypothetical protein